MKWNESGFRLPLALAAAAALFTAGPAAADKGKGKGKPQQVVPTGKEDAKPPTPAEQAADAELERITDQSSEGLTPVQRPDGSVTVDLEGRFQSVVVARKNADGTTSIGCVDRLPSKDAAPQAPAAPAQPAPTPALEVK